MKNSCFYSLFIIILLCLGSLKGFCGVAIVISGKVIDKSNKPIIGAYVNLICGEQKAGGVTDVDGKFKVSTLNMLNKKEEKFELRVSYVGYKMAKGTYRISVLNEGKGTIKVTMVEDTKKNKKVDSRIIFENHDIQDFLNLFSATPTKKTPRQLCTEADKYYKGIDGMPQNYQKALELYLQAAEQGYVWAQARVGYMYDTGKGCLEDNTKAFLWYKKAAEQGDAYAQNNLALLYENGEGVAQNYVTAAYWYKKSANQGYAWAQSNLAEFYYYGNGVEKDYKQAFTLALKSAEQGNKAGQFRLGYMYNLGQGVTQNYKLAREWYMKAAEQNHAAAMLNIGVLFENGRGVKKSSAEALAWYNKAAEKGNSSAKQYAKELVSKGFKAAIRTTPSSMDLAALVAASAPSTTPQIASTTTKPSAVSSSAKSNYDIAYEAFHSGAYDKALQLSQNAVLKDDDPRLHNLVGLMYLDGKGVKADYNKALEYIMFAATKQNAAAEYNLGYMYENGLGVNKDHKRAFDWYLRSAEHGDSYGQNKAGLFYEQGKDYLKAVEWYRKAIDNNNEYAPYNLGCLYANGHGVPVDVKKAFELYEKSALKGVTKAEYELAKCYEDGKGVAKDEKKAFSWYQKAAEHNHKIAQNYVGWCYDTGTGTTKDLKKAAEWYLKSAENGYYIAQSNIAYFYYKGIGVEKDEKKAFDWYMKSAKQGYGEAEMYVGWMYWNGQGVKQNYQEAINWYEKAAEHNNISALNNLAWVYYEGNHVKKDTKRALDLIEKAAKSGDADSQCSAGFFYSDDIPEKNYKKAYDWTLKAANQGNTTAINNIGWCYEHGYGVPKDMVKAVEYYKKAVDKNSVSGFINLGRMYENGYGGLTIDYKQAVELYRKAAEKENYKAMRNLARMYEKGLGVEKNMPEAMIWYSKAGKGGDAEAKERLAEFNDRLSTPPVAADNYLASQSKTIITNNAIPSMSNTTKRIALIIGNNDYGSQRLDNPVNDANDLNVLLQKLGFESKAYINLDKEEMENVIAEFAKNANNYDMALFFYAGHAIQSGDVNYLVPACPQRLLNNADIKRKYVDLPFVLNSMMDANAKRNIVILDACRDTPDFIGVNTRGAKRGLANVAEPERFLVAFSTQAGKTAADGTGMKNSPYTTVLLEQLSIPGLNVDQLFVRVRDNVLELTHNNQKPFYKNNLGESPKEKFYFNIGK